MFTTNPGGRACFKFLEWTSGVSSIITPMVAIFLVAAIAFTPLASASGFEPFDFLFKDMDSRALDCFDGLDTTGALTNCYNGTKGTFNGTDQDSICTAAGPFWECVNKRSCDVCTPMNSISLLSAMQTNAQHSFCEKLTAPVTCQQGVKIGECRQKLVKLKFPDKCRKLITTTAYGSSPTPDESCAIEFAQKHCIHKAACENCELLTSIAMIAEDYNQESQNKLCKKNRHPKPNCEQFNVSTTTVQPDAATERAKCWEKIKDNESECIKKGDVKYNVTLDSISSKYNSCEALMYHLDCISKVTFKVCHQTAAMSIQKWYEKQKKLVLGCMNDAALTTPVPTNHTTASPSSVSSYVYTSATQSSGYSGSDVTMPTEPKSTTTESNKTMIIIIVAMILVIIILLVLACFIYWKQTKEKEEQEKKCSNKTNSSVCKSAPKKCEKKCEAKSSIKSSAHPKSKTSARSTKCATKAILGPKKSSLDPSASDSKIKSSVGPSDSTAFAKPSSSILSAIKSKASTQVGSRKIQAESASKKMAKASLSTVPVGSAPKA